MDYQRFIDRLPSLYEDWGKASVRPKSVIFADILARVSEPTTANIMQLLNWAVECLEEDEAYLQIGCFSGVNLIGALLDRPDKIAYAVDDFYNCNDPEEVEQLSQNLADFNLEERVVFCPQNFEDFFGDLREIEAIPQIGVYFLSGIQDYRSQLLGLLLVKSFLAERSLIVVDNSNNTLLQQANYDFMTAHFQCQLLLDLPTSRADDPRFGNGLQVFSWDINLESNYSWKILVNSFRCQPVIQALANLSLEFEARQSQQVESLEREALTLDGYNQFGAAEAKYKEILDWDKNHANTWHNLGLLYYRTERYAEAQDTLLTAWQLAPDRYLYNYSLGLVLEKLGKAIEAIEFYRQAIALNPKHIESYNNLGNLLLQLGKQEEAESVYKQAIAVKPNHFGSHLNLGNLLMAKQQLESAIECYQKALELKPNEPMVLYNLGVAFAQNNNPIRAAIYLGNAAFVEKEYSEAIPHFQKVLTTQTGSATLYCYLAECYKELNREEEAIAVYEAGIKLFTDDASLYLKFIDDLQAFGKIERAIAIANETLKLVPNNLNLKLKNATLLPIIYEKPEDIELYRARFSQKLENFIGQTNSNDSESINNAFNAISIHTNLYLQYQGKNDLELQKIYGQFVRKITIAKYPKYINALLDRPVDVTKKIRVGYISALFYGRNIGIKLALGWLKNHNKQSFEIYCYHTGGEADPGTEQVQFHSDVFHHIPEKIEVICQQILNDKLDILVYSDIGMNPQIIQIAALRLAPVQCAAWGHPITSGLPTIDYFLTSDLMEPNNAEEHYLEKLVRLPYLGFSYTKPLLPEIRKQRSDFQIRDNAIVYLSCQTISKYLPQHDYIFAEIALRVPQAQFVFVESHISNSITNIFRHRLHQAFDRVGLNSQEYCSIVPRNFYSDYMNLHWLSDIFLDTFDWSGGLTTLDAISCNLPIVTCPGELMRGRQSYGILQIVGVTETIAQNEAEYIEIAVRLGIDREWRNQIKEQIAKNHHRLYDDKTCVTALEEFYRSVVQ